MSVPNPATTKWVPLWNTGSVGASSGLLTGDLVWSVLVARAGAVPCDGSLFNSVTDPSFASLYAAIGTTYGGTGPASFAVPDVRGRLLVCKGPNADVNAAGKTDGDANAANRTPLHWHAASGLGWSGAFAGVYANTTDFSNNHTHTFSGGTGYVSADHTHSMAAYAGGGQPPNQMMGQWFDHFLGDYVASTGISTNHTHAFNGTTDAANTSHVHGYTPSGSVSGSVNGNVGATGARPKDVPSYIVENCFIVK